MNSFLSEKESKPLTTCQHCKDRPCIKTGKVCKEIESYLNKCQAKDGYSDRHYRRKMIPFDPQILEYRASERAFQLKYGKKYDQKGKKRRHNQQAGE